MPWEKLYAGSDAVLSRGPQRTYFYSLCNYKGFMIIIDILDEYEAGPLLTKCED